MAHWWYDYTWYDYFYYYIMFGCWTGWILIGWETIKFFFNWYRDRSSYNTTLRHIFRELQTLRKVRAQRDTSTLDVHIVSRRPLYHCDPWWTMFKWGLENDKRAEWPSGLKKLDLTFIVQEEDAFKKTIKDRVQKLKGGRTITYAIKHMLYHMYYSTDDYQEPDAVVILDNTYTMLGQEDELHRDISYRNITEKSRTALVLVDKYKNQLDKGVEAVNEARPVEQEHSEYLRTDSSRYIFTILRKKTLLRKR